MSLEKDCEEDSVDTELYYPPLDVLKAGVLIALCTIIVIGVSMKRPDLLLGEIFAMGALVISCAHYMDDLMKPIEISKEKV